MANVGRVVIAGGTGFVGGEVVKTFQRLGYETFVISRKGTINTSKTPALLTGGGNNEDIKNLRTWKDIENNGLPSGTVAVINCCGQNVLDPLRRWNDGFKQLVYDSRVKTNQTLVKAIAKSDEKPSCFIHMSGVGFYPPDSSSSSVGGQTEASPGGQHDWLARLVVDWEAAGQLPASVPTRVVSLRSGVVLGRRGGMIQQTMIPFFLGVGGRMGSGDQVMPWIHVKDVAGLMVHCVQTSSCSGVYNTVAPEHVTNNSFTKAYAGALHRPSIFPVPGFVMKGIFGEERASMVLQSQTIVPQRTLESGYEYRFPTIAEACEEFAHLDYVDQDEDL